MSISRASGSAAGIALAALTTFAAFVAPAGCGAESGDCLRYSDCAPGLTCAYGKCVTPPSPAADGGATTSPDTASGDDGEAPEGAALPDGSTDDASEVGAGPGDGATAE